jgi:hypothetical protein
MPAAAQDDGAPSQEISRGIFEPVPAADRLDYRTDPVVKTSELVRVNLAAGLADQPAASGLLELYLPGPAGRVVAALRRGERTASGGEIWEGRLQGVELSSVVWVVDRKAGTITGHMSFPNGS